MSNPPSAPEPDGKDWTWVLDRPCPDCGFDAAALPTGVGATAEVARRIRADVEVWTAVLGAPGAADRPLPTGRPDPASTPVWSPVEYGGHVRDVHRIFAERLALMRTHDDPAFANWDQDATALAQRYDLAPADGVAAGLAEAARAVAAAYDTVRGNELGRTGRRSNGSTFTVATLAAYHLHDVEHHRWYVRAAATRAAYDRQAPAYAAASGAPTANHRVAFATMRERLGAGARVLEVGSGGGRDALGLEALGLSVRRTDVVPGFVALLRTAGHAAHVVDPLGSPTHDLADPDAPDRPYDGVWANASLLHVERPELAWVLTRLAGVTRAGGLLRITLKEGDGAGWSTHGSIGLPRWFTYWREPELRAVCEGSGWRVDPVSGVERHEGTRGEWWLVLLASRAG